MNRPEPDAAHTGPDALATAAWHAGLEAGERIAAAKQQTAALATLESLTVQQLTECVTALSALLAARTTPHAPQGRRLHLVQPAETPVSL